MSCCSCSLPWPSWGTHSFFVWESIYGTPAPPLAALITVSEPLSEVTYCSRYPHPVVLGYASHLSQGTAQAAVHRHITWVAARSKTKDTCNSKIYPWVMRPWLLDISNHCFLLPGAREVLTIWSCVNICSQKQRHWEPQRFLHEALLIFKHAHDKITRRQKTCQKERNCGLPPIVLRMSSSGLLTVATLISLIEG